MSEIAVAGAGAFGTALAISLSREGTPVTLWARNKTVATTMEKERSNQKYLPGVRLPSTLSVTSDGAEFAKANTILLVVPTQSLRPFLSAHATLLTHKNCVICCKGIEKGTGLLPSEVVAEILPQAQQAVLTGPGFAGEIAKGLPTALTFAMKGPNAERLQSKLSTQTLRLYLSDDLVGAQLGGALKNVIAIACGVAIGAGLGESARAALMTRGFSELQRLAVDLGAYPATLTGLSGLGDLALTCTSMQSRNFSLGYELGKGGHIGEGTIEGVATARATVTLASKRGIDMPLSAIVTGVLSGDLTISDAIEALLSRPLKTEQEKK